MFLNLADKLSLYAWIRPLPFRGRPIAKNRVGDPAEELRECWKITSNQTKTNVKGDPKDMPGINWKDVRDLLRDELVGEAVGLVPKMCE